MSIVYGLVFFIVGAVVITTVLPALLPSLYGGLNTTSAFVYTTGGTSYALPLANLFALNGVIPLLVVVAVFVGLIIGAVAIAGIGKSR